MSTDIPPKNWKDATHNITWGALVLTCFFVFIEKLVEQIYGQALAALVLGLAIMAVALHSKTWLERTNPNCVFGAFTVLLMAIVLAPFVEQRRWPFSGSNAPQAPVVIHEPPSAEDIAKATAPIQFQLENSIRQLDEEKANQLTLSQPQQNLFFGLEEVFNEIKAQQSTLQSEADALTRALIDERTKEL